MKHLCHATGCKTPVPASLFMCRKHWFMVPRKDRDTLWDLYVPGQEITKDPSLEYLAHARKCIDTVAAKESLPA